jgi:hypothetical protein
VPVGVLTGTIKFPLVSKEKPSRLFVVPVGVTVPVGVMMFTKLGSLILLPTITSELPNVSGVEG